MWIEVQPPNAPKETMWFGAGGVIAVSPGAVGSVLVFGEGREMDVEDDYSALKAKLVG